ncbi:hypothetical protein ACS0TY_000242 [Phlomoides rotata]
MADLSHANNMVTNPAYSSLILSGKFCGQGVALLEDCVQKMYQNSGARTRLIDYIARRAAVLHVISATQNCPTVGHLVLENSDYVIDSVCRQLCHLDVNPRVPNVLATMLSYVGVADKIFSLLEEPLVMLLLDFSRLQCERSPWSLKFLDGIASRHPILTLPFFKESSNSFQRSLTDSLSSRKAKASKHEACELPNEAELYKKDVNLRISNAINALDEENMDSGALHNGQDLPNGLKVI